MVYLFMLFFSNPGAKEEKKRVKIPPQKTTGEILIKGERKINTDNWYFAGLFVGDFPPPQCTPWVVSSYFFYSFVKLTGGKSWVFFSFFRFLSYFPLLMHCFNLLDAVIRDILEPTQFFHSERMQTQWTTWENMQWRIKCMQIANWW